MAFDELYKELVMEHYRNPRNWGEMADADAVTQVHNPVCGDSVKVYLKVCARQLSDVRFSGKMCAVSKASASLMSEAVKGQDVNRALLLHDSFQAMMQGNDTGTDMGNLKALKGVVRYPIRVKCALLPWQGLVKGIQAVKEA